MATYLYGLVLARNAAAIPSDVLGLAAARVRALDCGSLAAVVSTADRGPERAFADVRAHDGVLRAVVARGPTVAAVRFGQAFSDDAELRAHVVERSGPVERLLETLDGCVEMRLLLPAMSELATPEEGLRRPTAGGGEGRAYLERLKAEHDRMARLALRPVLGTIVRDERVEELPPPPLPAPAGGGTREQRAGRSPAIAFTHLIDRVSESEYREAVKRRPELAQAALVGPLALHTFAEPAP